MFGARCLYCGKGVGLPRVLWDRKFCRHAHALKYKELVHQTFLSRLSDEWRHPAAAEGLEREKAAAEAAGANGHDLPVPHFATR
ncbi:MAG: hypothetical protein U0Q18_32040 [Bryobacteraceae bacterium]